MVSLTSLTSQVNDPRSKRHLTEVGREMQSSHHEGSASGADVRGSREMHRKKTLWEIQKKDISDTYMEALSRLVRVYTSQEC